MLSFHNDPAIKEKYLSRVKDHYDQDEIIKGFYWENGKGCAVGCTIHGSSHIRYQEELNIPIILAKVQDRIFEGLPNSIAKEFPLKFLSSIEVGVDLIDVWPKFASWLLIDEESGVIKFAKNKEQKKYIKLVGDYYVNHKNITALELKIDAAYASAAYTSAAHSAVYAAYSAVYSAASASSAAAFAASAASAASAAAAAYAYAAYDSCAAYASYAVYTAAQERAYIIQSEKLLELLKEAK